MKQCCKDYLLEQFGDEDIIAEIYGEYRNTIDEKIVEIDSALAAGNWVAIDKAAHAIKGCALTAGDNETAEVAIALRKASHLQSDAEAKALAQRLKELRQAL